MNFGNLQAQTDPRDEIIYRLKSIVSTQDSIITGQSAQIADLDSTIFLLETSIESKDIQLLDLQQIQKADKLENFVDGYVDFISYFLYLLLLCSVIYMIRSAWRRHIEQTR